MSRVLLACAFLAVLMGCATTARQDTRLEKTTNPPNKLFLDQWQKASASDLEKLSTGPQEQNLLWWKTYQLGVLYSEKEKAKSCDNFRSLAEDATFPLKDLALLRSHEVCPAEKRLPLPTTINPWYKELYLDIKLAENEDAATLLERAKLESNTRKKEQLLLRALDKAKAEKSDANIQAAEKSLYHVSPRFIPNPETSEWISVANDQRAHREFDKALVTFQKVLHAKSTSTDEKFQALKGLRMTYKIMERRNDYVAATSDLVNWARQQFNAHKKDNRSVQRFHDAQILLAKTLWTENQTSQAVKTLGETQRLLKGRYPMDEVYFIQGRIEEEKGHIEKALEYYDASYKEKSTLSGLQDKLLWLKAWNYFKLKKYDEALLNFQQMKEKVKDPSDQARAAFWLARCLKIKNQAPAAQDVLDRLSQDDPLGYYGVLAYREMKKDMPALSFDPDKELDLNLLNLGEVDAHTRLGVEWLIAVDEKAFLEKILNDIVDELKHKNISKEQTWLTISSAYARAGLYLPLFTTLGNLNPNVKDQLLKSHPDLLFPLPYQNLVESASKMSGTPAPYIYSIIRQESAFNPEARSPVDARGLMQLLPSIAKTIAENNKLTYHEPDDLYRPEINIPLGAFELKSLSNRYKDQFILSTAAYNANAGAIRGWVNNRYRADVVEFIEEIPYEETRTYIKLVLRNDVFYGRMLNKKQPTPFPENLLNFTSTPEKSQSETGKAEK